MKWPAVNFLPWRCGPESGIRHPVMPLHPWIPGSLGFRMASREPPATLHRYERANFGNYGANHGTRIIALADRNSIADHPAHLAVRRAELIARLSVSNALLGPRQILVHGRTGMADQIKRNGFGALHRALFALAAGLPRLQQGSFRRRSHPRTGLAWYRTKGFLCAAVSSRRNSAAGYWWRTTRLC